MVKEWREKDRDKESLQEDHPSRQQTNRLAGVRLAVSPTRTPEMVQAKSMTAQANCAMARPVLANYETATKALASYVMATKVPANCATAMMVLATQAPASYAKARMALAKSGDDDVAQAMNDDVRGVHDAPARISFSSALWELEGVSCSRKNLRMKFELISV